MQSVSQRIWEPEWDRVPVGTVYLIIRWYDVIQFEFELTSRGDAPTLA